MRKGSDIPLEGLVPDLDERRMHSDCLARARDRLRRHDMAGALLCDPLNVRYVTTDQISNKIWNLHSNFRYALIPVESDPVLWEFSPAVGLTKAAWAGDVRTAPLWQVFGAGPAAPLKARTFARDIASELAAHGIQHERLGVDRLEVDGYLALREAGVPIADAQLAMAEARAVKSPDEIKAMRHATTVCDAAVAQLRSLLKPGITELELWAAFTARAIELGAEYSEARLLVSGPRTKPWLREASDRVIERGDLVAFDTDMVGPHGYETDISRTYLCGDTKPASDQHRIYSLANDFLRSALTYFRPGASFEEIGQRVRAEMPRKFETTYPLIAHGVGRTLEYPVILWDLNHAGELQENMVMSVEVYVSAADADEGVKLEEEILITRRGYETLSSAPYDDRLTS